MITRELKEKVLLEAQGLREHATTEEKSKLDFSTLKPNDVTLCIYGQMTGDCFSERAECLCKKVTYPYSSALQDGYRTVNWHYYDGSLRKLTPIEFYITEEGAKNETLISFIKGELQNLTVEDL